jgi:hypothetical protein
MREHMQSVHKRDSSIQKLDFLKDVESRSPLLMWGPAAEKGGGSFLLVKSLKFSQWRPHNVD